MQLVSYAAVLRRGKACVSVVTGSVDRNEQANKRALNAH
jgi:hypothetical protein